MKLFILGTLMFNVIAGIATFHISQIFMTGSIFNWLRNAIKRKSDESLFFGKLDELFGCSLCMSTQVSLWFFAVPVITVIFWFLYPVVQLFPFTITTVFIMAIAIISLAAFITMAPAGISFLLFKLSDMLDVQAELMRDELPEPQFILINNDTDTLPNEAPVIDLEAFTVLIDNLEASCDKITHCAIARMSCRQSQVKKFVSSIFRAYQYENSEHQTAYESCLGIIVKHYINERSALRFWDREDWYESADRAELIQHTWSQMLDDKPLMNRAEVLEA